MCVDSYCNVHACWANEGKIVADLCICAWIIFLIRHLDFQTYWAAVMWKANAGTKLNISNGNDDDWETDPDFVNDVTEEEQRWGSRTVEGSGRTAGAIE